MTTAMKNDNAPADTIARLESAARQVRQDIVWMIHKAGDGHPGASLSVADILVTLYFGVMQVDPENPRNPDRDRCILSKGHSCPALLYVRLQRRKGRPSAIIAHTVKGKGVSFMEHQKSWHGRAPIKEEYESAVKELQGDQSIESWDQL